MRDDGGTFRPCEGADIVFDSDFSSFSHDLYRLM